MRSPRTRILTITKNHAVPMPGYIQLIHRHFEKSQPRGEGDGTTRTFAAPLDLLRLSVKDEEVLSGIEEVSLVYRKG